jgi:cytidylate kinase
MKLNSPFAITISRQLGSGGAYIGQQLAKRLNAYYADREIILQAAKKLSVGEDDLKPLDEKITSFWQSCLESYTIGTPDSYIPLPQYFVPTDRILFKTESDIIEHIAKEHSAIFIGRCSAYVLRNHPNKISVYLHANKAFRISRIQELYKVSEKEAEKMINRSDKERANYNQTFSGIEWTDVRQYDLCIDVSKIGIEGAISLILKSIE